MAIYNKEEHHTMCNSPNTAIDTPDFKIFKQNDTYRIHKLNRNTWHMMTLNEAEVSMLVSLLDGGKHTKGGDE